MNKITLTHRVLHDVSLERARQDTKWGVQSLSPDTWMTILAEEVGELAQAILHTRFGGGKAAGNEREEAVQIAAVAVAIVEAIDRGDFGLPAPAPKGNVTHFGPAGRVDIIRRAREAFDSPPPVATPPAEDKAAAWFDGIRQMSPVDLRNPASKAAFVQMDDVHKTTP